MTELARWREAINQLDDQIVDLLAARLALCEKVGDYKHRNHLPVRMPERIAIVRQRCVARARTHGLNEAFVDALYALIIEEACRTEESLLAKQGKAEGRDAPERSPADA